MKQEEIYTKTDKGREEIQTRKYKLAPRLRTLLIMIDGRTRAGDILKQTAPLRITSEEVDQLHAQGFIAFERASPAAQSAPVVSAAAAPTVPERERFSVAQRFMNESAVDASGLLSFRFTLKLEKCGSVDDLRALLPDYIKLIEKGTGGAEAEVLIRKMKELLV